MIHCLLYSTVVYFPLIQGYIYIDRALYTTLCSVVNKLVSRKFCAGAEPPFPIRQVAHRLNTRNLVVLCGDAGLHSIE